MTHFLGCGWYKVCCNVGLVCFQSITKPTYIISLMGRGLGSPYTRPITRAPNFKMQYVSVRPSN